MVFHPLNALSSTRRRLLNHGARQGHPGHDQEIYPHNQSCEPGRSSRRRTGLTKLLQELEFLCDSDLITQQQMSSIISQLPSEHEARAAVSSEGVAESMNHMNVQDSGYQNYNAPSASPSFQAHNTGDQRNPSPAPLRHTPSPQPIYQAPPAYPATPVQAPQALGYATAMYVYNGTDAGDLNLQPNDRISITEVCSIRRFRLCTLLTACSVHERRMVERQI